MNELLAGRRILVVEDEVMLRVTMEDFLADLGCKMVAAAATTEDAIVLINGQVFDAALLDINLNGKSSLVVAETLAARGVPFVFMTGNRGDMWDGFRDRPILRKPFRHDDLIPILARILID
jgi:CheY-like chemotaxis protein